MKYALLTAALAAVSVATVVNIDVEGTELEAENNRHHNRLSRHHHHDRQHHHRDNNRRGRHWWSDLFSSGRNNHHNRNHNRNERDRPRRYDLDELLEDLFRVNFECTRNSEWSKEQFEECYRKKTEDINDDLIERDDDIFEDQNYEDEEGHHRRNHRNHRHVRHHKHRHGRQYEEDEYDTEQTVLSSGRRHHRNHRDRRNNEYQCQVEVEDPMRREQIARQCCEDQQLGRYNPDNQTCDIEGRDDKDEFQECAYSQGAFEAYCQRERNGRDRED